jgi:hypothetical protein
LAQLKSVGSIDLINGATTVYEVSPDTPYAKLTELIVANTSGNTVSCKISIFKASTNQEIVIIPDLKLLSNQSNIINMATCLNAHDQVICTTSVPDCIDILVSCVEM